MKLYLVEDGKLVPYKRLGECKRCGECCRKKITFQWDIAKPLTARGPTYEATDWLPWEGFSVIFARGIYWYVKVTSLEGPKPGDERVPCGSLDGDLCAIRDDQFKIPLLCPLWPVHPKDLFPGCGYRFEKEDK